MLNETLVLDYIKRNLGFPVMQIEISDDDIINYVKNYTLPFFSRYKPLEKYTVIDLEKNPDLQIDDTTFKIPPDPNHKLLAVTEVIPSMAAYMVSGFPINPFPTWQTLPNYLLQMTKALTARKYSLYQFTFQFIRPDKIKILPKLGESFYLLFATFVHTFETIHTDWERHFLDLALADICDYIASLRVKYQNYSTPYGDINLNWDYFQNRANEIRQRVLDDLRKTKSLVYVKVR